MSYYSIVDRLISYELLKSVSSSGNCWSRCRRNHSKACS